MTGMCKKLAGLLGREEKSECPVSGKRSVKIGWLVDAPGAGLIYDAPRRLKSTTQGKHPKSASRCPAVLDLEARYFEIPCPHDIHLKLAKNKEDQWVIVNLLGENGSVRPSTMKKLVHLVNPKEWRHPGRPMLQVNAPYRFVADEEVYITQCGPFMDYKAQSWPGQVFSGRFPLHLWPRVLMWAFEWHNTSKELKIRRGSPWFYAFFETTDPSRPVKMVEAEMTEDLRSYVKQLDGVTNYVNQTYSLFDRAARVRPKTLLKERASRFDMAGEAGA